MTKRISTLHVLALSILITNAGCGIVGDKDRIPMARMGENVITRGDFSMALRKLPPEQKPIIRTKGDVRSALNDYIDDQIKALEAERLEAAGEVDVEPRIAEQRFFAEHPDIMDVRGVTDVNTLPVAITPVELENLKQSIEEGIARTRRELLRENAMRHLVIQAFQTNRFEISEAEWEREYKIQKSGLFHPPRATVKALAIAAVNDEAAAIAAEFRQRVDRGEAFNDVFDEYVADAKGTALETEMVYDPAAPHLRSFWESVNGIAPGSLFGPVTIASQVITVEDALGNPRQQQTPPTFLVGKVTDFVEPLQKTLEESKPDMAASVLFVRVMEELRQRYDVEIYEKNLYSPDVSFSGGAGPIKPQEQAPVQQ